MRMHARRKKNQHLFFLLAQIFTTYRHQHRVHERFISILGREAVVAGVKVTPIWGN